MSDKKKRKHRSLGGSLIENAAQFVFTEYVAPKIDKVIDKLLGNDPLEDVYTKQSSNNITKTADKNNSENKDTNIDIPNSHTSKSFDNYKKPKTMSKEKSISGSLAKKIREDVRARSEKAVKNVLIRKEIKNKSKKTLKKKKISIPSARIREEVRARAHQAVQNVLNKSKIKKK